MYSINNVAGNSDFRPVSSSMSDREQSVGSITLISKRPTSVTTPTDSIFNGFFKDFGENNTFVQAMGIGTAYDGSDGMIPELPQMGSSTYFGIFNNFLLTEVAESREELVRIITNFGGSWNAFFFGENPRVFTFSGMFLDSPEYPYYQEFVQAYDTYLSGRKCLINNMRMTITYDGRIVNGHILRLIDNMSAQEARLRQFTFTVLVESDGWVRYNIADKGKLLNYMNNSKRYLRPSTVANSTSEAQTIQNGSSRTTEEVAASISGGLTSDTLAAANANARPGFEFSSVSSSTPAATGAADQPTPSANTGS